MPFLYNDIACHVKEVASGNGNYIDDDFLIRNMISELNLRIGSTDYF
jgi:hypothetical protein